MTDSAVSTGSVVSTGSSDVIVAVDGESIAGVPSNVSTARIKGPAGTEVALRLIPVDGGKAREVVVERADVRVPAVDGELRRVEACFGWVSPRPGGVAGRRNVSRSGRRLEWPLRSCERSRQTQEGDGEDDPAEMHAGKSYSEGEVQRGWHTVRLPAQNEPPTSSLR